MRQWSDLSSAEKAEVTKTEPNEARFWSGESQDVDGDIYGGEDNARELAEQDGGKTLEMKLDENGIDKTSMSSDDWKEASNYYAEGASGDVKCYKGEDTRKGNVYEGDEKKVIENNTDINSVSEVDPVAGQSRGTYTRNADGNLESSSGKSYTNSGVENSPAEQLNGIESADKAPATQGTEAEQLNNIKSSEQAPEAQIDTSGVEQSEALTSSIDVVM